MADERGEELRKQLGRIALRREGEMWNAYFAKVSTMDGAILLGSIRMTALADNEPRKAAFIQLMTDIIGDITNDVVGVDPSWSTSPAPEHERSGNG